jgi:hypothetical protein
MVLPVRKSSLRKHTKLGRKKFFAQIEGLEDRAMMAAFTPGDLAVYRVGGVAGNPAAQFNSPASSYAVSGTLAAKTVFIDEYTPAGAFVQTVNVSALGGQVSGGATNPFSALTSDFTAGEITRSADGQALLIPGYGIAPESAGITGSANTAIPREIATLTQNLTLNTSTSLNGSGGDLSFSTNTIRGAASLDGTSFYATGANASADNGGLRYVDSLGAHTATSLNQNLSFTDNNVSSTTGDNDREAVIFNGRLFLVSGASAPGRSVMRVGSDANPLPTTNAQAVPYSYLFPRASTIGYIQYNTFRLFDLDPANGDPQTGGADTLYVVNSNAQNGLYASLDKYNYSNSTGMWTLTSSSSGPDYGAGNGSLYGLTGYNNGSTVNLFMTTTQGVSATNQTGVSQLVSFTDTAGYNQPANGSLVTLVKLNDPFSLDGSGNVNNTDFKGIELVPSAAPVVTAGAGGNTFTENGTAAVVAPTLTITDADAVTNDISSASISITNYVAGQDVLSFTAPGGSNITGFFDTTSGTLSLTGADSIANYQLALRSVTYANTSDNPTGAARSVQFIVSDASLVPSVATGVNPSASAAAVAGNAARAAARVVATASVNITAVNDAPAVSAPVSVNIGTHTTFTDINNNAITVSDIDGNSGTETITLTVSSGTLSLSGGLGTGNGTNSVTYTGTLTQLNAALDGLTYTYTGSGAATDTLNISLNDNGFTGTGGSLIGTGAVTINLTGVPTAPPVVTTTVTALSYTENAGALAVDSGVTVTDADSANSTGALVSITSGFAAAEDSLQFTDQNGIHGVYNATTGVLKLTGVASTAFYQTALQSVTYTNNSENPSTTARVVRFVVSDGTDINGLTSTRSINVISVNDPPVNSVPGTQYMAISAVHSFNPLLGNQLSISDVDAGTAAVKVTLTVSAGAFTMPVTTGLTLVAGGFTGSATVSFTGTIAAINAAFSNGGLNYTAPSTAGMRTLTMVTNDQGNTPTPAQSTTTVVNLVVLSKTVADINNAQTKFQINEILINPPGVNSGAQWVEVRATTGAQATFPAGTYLVNVEGDGGAGPNPGSMNDVFDLSGMATGTNGVLALLEQANNYQKAGFYDVTNSATGSTLTQGIANTGFGNNNPDSIAGPNNSTVKHSAQNFGTSDTVDLEGPSSTWMLLYAPVAPTVKSTGVAGTDIDPTNTGTPGGSEYANWVVLDAVGLIDASSDVKDVSYAVPNNGGTFITFVDNHGGVAVTPSNSSQLGQVNYTIDFTPDYIARINEASTALSAGTDWVAGAFLTGANPPATSDPAIFTLSTLKTSLSGYDGVAINLGTTNGLGQYIPSTTNDIGGLNFLYGATGSIYTKPVIDINGNKGEVYSTGTASSSTTTGTSSLVGLDDGRNWRASFVQGGAAVNVGNSNAADPLVLTNYGNATDTFTTASVTISNLLDGASEVLNATITGTVTSKIYNPVSGVLTLSGAAMTMADLQTALRSVTYGNSATSTLHFDSRILNFSVTDTGGATSLPSSTTVGIVSNRAGSVRINELDVNPPNQDNPYEYVEISGTPGTSLNNYYFVGVEGDAVSTGANLGQTGRAQYVFNLAGFTIGSTGLLVIKSPTGGFSIPAGTTVVTDTNFDNVGGTLGNGTASFFLMYNTTPSAFTAYTYNGSGQILTTGTDFDTSGGGSTLDTGTFTLPTGTEIIDNVGWYDNNNAADKVYGSVELPLEYGAPNAATRVYTSATNTVTTAIAATSWYYGILTQTSNTSVTYLTGNVTGTALTGRAGTLPATTAFITPGYANGTLAPTQVVTNVSDTGAGSLRQALLNISTLGVVGSTYTVQFAIPGSGLQLITPASALPGVTNAIIVSADSTQNVEVGSGTTGLTWDNYTSFTKTGTGFLAIGGAQTAHPANSTMSVQGGTLDLLSSVGTNVSLAVGNATGTPLLLFGGSQTVKGISVTANGTAGIIAAGGGTTLAPQPALVAGGGDPSGYVPGDKYVVTNTLAVASGGHFDVNDGILVVNDITANGGTQDTLNLLVKHGNPRSTGALGNFHPNLGEIRSTTANDDYNNFLGATSVGWVDNFDTGYKNINGSNSLLKTGTLITPPVDNGIQYIFKYVYAGDTNLDGKVNNTDLQNLVANYNQTTNGNTTLPVTTFDGDFNGDGIVDSKDLAILVGNYNSGTTGSSFGPLRPSVTSAASTTSVTANDLALAALPTTSVIDDALLSLLSTDSNKKKSL